MTEIVYKLKIQEQRKLMYCIKNLNSCLLTFLIFVTDWRLQGPTTMLQQYKDTWYYGDIFRLERLVFRNKH
jgi:hypothetical protein